MGQLDYFQNRPRAHILASSEDNERFIVVQEVHFVDVHMVRYIYRAFRFSVKIYRTARFGLLFFTNKLSSTAYYVRPIPPPTVTVYEIYRN